MNDDLAAEPWDVLERELALWRAAGRSATLWWRDDDATRPEPALERLLSLAARWTVPLALAVVPAAMERGLAALLARFDAACALQHGYAHVDHAARDEPGAELGEHRAAAVVLAELEQGMARLSSELGGKFVPVLVPPFNRIAAPLVPCLAGLGFRGLSCFAPRTQRVTAEGLVLANCHVDPVNWRRGNVFRGEAKCLSALVGHLAARREGRVDADEPTGLLTHHWSHDEACWDFLERLLARLAGNGAVRWVCAREVFAA